MNNNNFWTPEIWSRINGQVGQDGSRQAGYRQPGALKEAMGLIRVAQQIFPTQVRGTDDPIPADTINLENGVPSGIPSAGETKPVVTIIKSFQLAAMHIKDPDLTMAMNQVMLAAQSLALAEDALFFQGKKAMESLDKDKNLTVTDPANLGEGLLGIADETISVAPQKDTGGQEVIYGSETFKAVIKGISRFANVQARPFALILDPATFADANTPLQDSSIVTPASAINALMGDGGYFTMSPSLPELTGLLVSLGGKTTQLYVGTEPIVEFESTEKGIFNFTAQESIQFHNIDPRSLIKLVFGRIPDSGSQKPA